MSKVIGIDLGTTNSCVSFMDGKDPKVMKTQRGQDHAINGGFCRRRRALSWSGGKTASCNQSENTLFAIKRLIGRRHDDDNAKKFAELMPYQVVPGENGDAWVEANSENTAQAKFLRSL